MLPIAEVLDGEDTVATTYGYLGTVIYQRCAGAQPINSQFYRQQPTSASSY
jgi:hypothetical protein